MIGRWSFAVVGSSQWNSLLAALRRPEMTLHIFKWQLKADLFHIWCVDEQKEHPPPPGAVVAFFCDSGAGHKTADLLTAMQALQWTLQDDRGKRRLKNTWKKRSRERYANTGLWCGCRKIPAPAEDRVGWSWVVYDLHFIGSNKAQVRR